MIESDPRFPYGSPRPAGASEGPVNPPLVRSTSWAGATAESQRQSGARESHEPFFYPRYGHPNAKAFEAVVAANERCDGALSYASGMAAIHAALTFAVSAGDRIAVARQVYGGTEALCREELPRYGVGVDRFDALDPSSLDRVLERGPKLVWVETPINPTLRIVDLQAIVSRSHDAGALVACDATFAPAPVQWPAGLGVDLVFHSLTKYYGGHSDVLGGVLAGPHLLLTDLERNRARTGAILGPDQAWLLQRSFETHGLRVEKQCRSAATIARWLDGHTGSDGPLAAVHHPSLPGHPDHELAARQMPGGGGGVVTLDHAGGLDGAVGAFDALHRIARAPSLGGVESLACLPCHSSHASLSERELVEAGIAPGAVRVSVGIEPVAELIGDLASALGLPEPDCAALE